MLARSRAKASAHPSSFSRNNPRKSRQWTSHRRQRLQRHGWTSYPRIVREATIAKPYGWIFFYQSNEFLDNGDPRAMLVGNAPIIVDRNTSELRVTGTARPLEEYLAKYEAALPPAALQRTPQPPAW